MSTQSTDEQKQGIIAKLAGYIKRNPFGSTLFVSAATALVGIAVMQGCSFGSFIKARVPQDVQKVTGAAPKIVLDDAADVRQRYVDRVTSSLDEFDRNIANADALRNFLRSWLNTGLDLGTTALGNSGIPAGGFLVLALSGLAGLFMEKPGSKAKNAAITNKEKQDSYNAGLNKGLAAAPTRATTSERA